jgi:hypothetical protein
MVLSLLCCAGWNGLSGDDRDKYRGTRRARRADERFHVTDCDSYRRRVAIALIADERLRECECVRAYVLRGRRRRAASRE